MDLIVKTAVAICSLGLLAALLCCNFSFNIGVLCGSAILWAIGGFLVGKKEIARFPLWLFCISFVFYLLVIFAIQSPQVSDFLFLINSARDFIDGNTTAFHTTYVNDWPDLCAAGIVDVIMLSIVNKITFIKACQAAASSTMCVLAYLILREITAETYAQAGSTLLAIFPLFTFSIEMANNQVLSALFCMASLYLFVRYAQQRNALNTSRVITLAGLMGFFVAIARFIRPDAVLAIIALAISLLILAFNSYKNQTAEKPIRLFGAFAPALSALLIYVVATSLLSLSLHATGIASEEQHGENVAFNKLLMGTDLETSGGWSIDYQKLNTQRSQREGVSYREAAMRTIVERITDPGYTANLTIKKIQRLWWTNSEAFNLNHLNGNIHAYITAIEKSWVLLLIIANLALFARLWKRKCTLTETQYLLPFIGILALTICAYLLIEVQPRYLYFAYIIMFILATVAIYELRKSLGEATTDRAQKHTTITASKTPER
ncbi:glycosyltransferase family 39 protein [Adlercreutzia sp. R21]|uniref:glycosyltransferase family 39 protein n=1 Tax=Adlercreutzia wanghongyangiae TaxID=3111451 RepID=UPI002DB8B308|nr:glycosyltransferase family 39 protein [Adlercreutzia sp. R21]MEC4185350.1 glycosyltransferase family 39 protein [Adlercreutzia sp. R21]